MNDQKNMILAFVLSAIVLLTWEYFYAMPQRQRQEALQRQIAQTQPIQPPSAAAPVTPAIPGPQTASAPAQACTTSPLEPKSREAVLASTQRIPIDTPQLKGSISLTGGRIDDVSLAQYRETVDPNSPAVVLLSPAGSPSPFYAEFGWVGPANANVKVPGSDTAWRQEGSGALAPGQPITLLYDNGEGLTFRRTIAVDEKYLFTLKDEVVNTGDAAVSLFPCALVTRHGTPRVSGYYVLHEGLIGVLGDQGEQQITYKSIEDKKIPKFDVTNAWMGITDKYW